MEIKLNVKTKQNGNANFPFDNKKKKCFKNIRLVIPFNCNLNGFINGLLAWWLVSGKERSTTTLGWSCPLVHHHRKSSVQFDSLPAYYKFYSELYRHGIHSVRHTDEFVVIHRRHMCENRSTNLTTLTIQHFSHVSPIRCRYLNIVTMFDRLNGCYGSDSEISLALSILIYTAIERERERMEEY